MGEILYEEKIGMGGMLRVTRGVYRGKVVYDLRRWYWTEEGKLAPTRKGVVIGAESAEKVAAALLTPMEEVERAQEQIEREAALEALRGERDGQLRDHRAGAE